MTWEVRIVEKGRSGHIDYIEDGEICRCEWEFGGGDTLAILLVPATEEWDTRYPWARGRRQEVLSRVATETCRQRAPLAVIEWDHPGNFIYLKEKQG